MRAETDRELLERLDEALGGCPKDLDPLSHLRRGKTILLYAWPQLRELARKGMEAGGSVHQFQRIESDLHEQIYERQVERDAVKAQLATAQARIAFLENEVHEWEESDAAASVLPACLQCEDLKARIAELEGDKERLDWAGKYIENGHTNGRVTTFTFENPGDDLRAAIDAARQKEQG